MSDWPLVHLGDYIDLQTGHPFKSKDFSDSEGITLLRGDNIVQGQFRWENVKRWPDEQLIERHNNYFLKEGDVILAMDRPWIEAGLKFGQIIKKDLPCLLVQRTSCLRAKNGLNQDFLRYLISSYSFVEYVKLVQTGTAVPHISGKQINGFEFRLPPKSVQESIGNILKSLDVKSEINRQTNQTLEHIAQAIFKNWFVDFEPTRAKIAAKQIGQARHDSERSAALKEALLADDHWPEAVAAAIAEGDPERAAMAAISGKSLNEIDQLSPEQQEQLLTTAALFPDALVDSELGEIPEGWEVNKIDDVVERLKPKKRYTKKQVETFGLVPVYEQGADILLGFHNDEAGFEATPENPLFIFGDHTCVIHLSCEDFDISQNVIPLSGNGFPTIWVYYAVQDRQEFQEYRRHWSEFIIKQVVVPTVEIADKYARFVTNLYQQKEQLARENKALEQLRDSLLPKLLSGELTANPNQTELDKTA